MDKIIVSTKQAPAAIGPYAQAVRVGNLVFLSGQLGLDPDEYFDAIREVNIVSEEKVQKAMDFLYTISGVLSGVVVLAILLFMSSTAL